MLFVVSGVHCELTADIRIFLSLLLCFLVLFMAILVSMSRLATLATHCLDFSISQHLSKVSHKARAVSKSCPDHQVKAML